MMRGMKGWMGGRGECEGHMLQWVIGLESGGNSERVRASAHARGNVATHAAHGVAGSLSWSPRMLNTRGGLDF